MITYRLHADALLRLVAIASGNPSADPGEVLALVQGAEINVAEPTMPQVGNGPALDGADKLAKPE